MFEELLGNEFFRAGSLVTKWPDECIWIEERYEEPVPHGKIEKAEEKKINNLVIAKDMQPVGFVPVHVAKRTIVLKEKSVTKGIQLRISADLRLVPLINKLIELGPKG